MQGISREIWRQNVKYKNEKSIKDTWKRLAEASAEIEDDKEKYKQLFYWLLEDFKFVPGGRINANLGTDRINTTLFNCFVHHPRDLNIKDIDSIENIYNMLKAQAHTLKSEGGFGLNASWIRPKGSYINGIDSRTPGVIKFMDLWDKSSEVITLGSDKIIGKKKKTEKKKLRKGAMMLVLSCWHPDILDFIKAKQTPNKLTKFNISVGAFEDLMQKVINNESWDLRFPDTSFEKYKEEWDGNIYSWEEKKYPVIIYKTIRARELWDLIMSSTYSRNEPGVIFFDTINKLNPLSYNEFVDTTNPCQPGYATVLAPSGIKKINEVSVGDIIWSGKKWAVVINKISRGIKPVYLFRTTTGYFIGTEDHKIVQNNNKIKVKEAESIDWSIGKSTDYIEEINEQDIMDGLVIGDGSIHKASNNLVYLIIGKKDYDYFESEINYLIIKNRPGLHKGAYEIKTTITHDELPKTYERIIPDRFFYGSSPKKKGFLRGLFTANGSLSGSRVTLKQTSKILITQVQEMLSSIGIHSYITVNKSKENKFSNGIYTMKESYDLNITDNRDEFKKHVGFIQKYKQESIKPSGRTSYFTSNIKEKEFLEDCEVFDITIDDREHTYWTGGCLAANCGEIPMATGICCLGSINLTQFIKDNNFDFETFKTVIELGIRFLDNVNTISNTPLPEYKKAAEDKRRIGLGVMGLGSMLFMLNIKYGSQESIDLIEKIFETKMTTELLTSAKLGEEKGSFKLFDKDKYFNTNFWNNLPISPCMKEEIEQIGEMRNSHRSMNAPTGNTGVLANCVSGGIEPVFLKEYIRWVIVPEHSRIKLREKGLKYPDVYNGEWYETEHFKFSKKGDEEILKGLFNGKDYEIDKNRGLTVSVLIEDYGWKYIKENNPELINSENMITTEELTVNDHINVLKTISKYVDQASSKTVNIPGDYPFNDFKELYLNAYKSKLKGITTYRAGTMTAVLEKKETQKYQNELDELYDKVNGQIIEDIIKLPKEYHSKGYKVRDNNGKKWYMHIAFADSSYKKPFALFVNTNNKESNEVTSELIETMEALLKENKIKESLIVKQKLKYEGQSNVTKIARAIGMALRHNIPMIKIVESLDKFNPDISSFIFHLKKLLSTFIKDGTEVKTEKCPECNKKLSYQQGCKSCPNCGWSKC